MRAAKNSKWRSRTCHDSSRATPSAPVQPKCSAAAKMVAAAPSPERQSRLLIDGRARRPCRVGVERKDRARQALECETLENRRGEPRRVDLDHALRRKILVETAAEVAARLNHHRARRRDIEPVHLEEHRIGALLAAGGADHANAADLERAS